MAIAALTWLLLGVATVLFASAQPDVVEAQVVMASVALVFGVWVFVSHGGHQVTAAGVYSLASAALVGYAGLWWVAKLGETLPSSLFVATSAGYFSHVVMYYAFWRSDGSLDRPSVSAHASIAVWAINVGIVLAATSLVVRQFAEPIAGYMGEGVYAGIILFSVGLAAKPTAQRLGLWRVIGLSIGVIAYVELIFTGFGRLRVTSLGVAIAILVSSRLAGRALKFTMLLVAPMAVYLLAQIRQGVVLGLYGQGVPARAGEPDSEVGPLLTFARLISSDEALPSGNGSTFWATLVAPIPRRFWEGKPDGFGTELTRMFEPQLLSEGHSMAALSIGEWFYNWSWPGVAVMVVVVGILVKLLDRILDRLLTTEIDSHSAAVFLAATVIVVAALGDLVWGGSFIFGVRAGTRIALLFIVAGLIALTRPRARFDGRSRTSRRRPASERLRASWVSDAPPRH